LTTEFTVLPKNVLWPHYSGPQELGGPGSLNRLNPRFLRHCSSCRRTSAVLSSSKIKNGNILVETFWYRLLLLLLLLFR